MLMKAMAVPPFKMVLTAVGGSSSACLGRHRVGAVIFRSTTTSSKAVTSQRLCDFGETADEYRWWRLDKQTQLTAMRDISSFTVKIELFNKLEERDYYIVEDEDQDHLQLFVDGIQDSLNENKSSNILLSSWLEITPSGVVDKEIEETVLSTEGMLSLLANKSDIEAYMNEIRKSNRRKALEFCSPRLDYRDLWPPNICYIDDEGSPRLDYRVAWPPNICYIDDEDIEEEDEETTRDLMKRFKFDKTELGLTQEEYDIWIHDYEIDPDTKE